MQIQTTVQTPEQAERLAGELVERRLAACVQIVSPVQSTYRWEGEVRREQELLLLVKTSRERAREAVAEVERLHPYDTPEVLVLPVEWGSAGYLEWVGAQTAAEPFSR